MNKDIDLLKMWGGKDENSERHLNASQSQASQIAKKKSGDIFEKIKRNMKIETIASILIAVVFPFLFYNEGVFFYILVVLMIFALVITLRLNRGYFQKINSVNSVDTKTSLINKISILESFIKKLKLYLFIITPISFYTGFAFSLGESEINLQRIVVLVLFTLPFLPLVIWLGVKYINALYGKYLKSLKNIHSNLITDENDN